MSTAKNGKPVPEHRASGETERIYHEVRQSLRVTGVPLSLQDWAGYRSFPLLWEAVRPNVETRAFEEAANRLRQEAVGAADHLGRLSVLPKAQLGESQAFQVEASLMLYHYIDPKLLLLASVLSLALEGELSRGADSPSASADLIERGAPPRMAVMELVAARPEEEPLRRVFRDIRRVSGGAAVDGAYRTLALWPRYLQAAWEQLKPMMKGQAYATAALHLAKLSRALARSLPYPVSLARLDERDAAAAAVRLWEDRLPGLTLNISLLGLDWQAPELLRRSPFPAKPRVR